MASQGIVVLPAPVRSGRAAQAAAGWGVLGLSVFAINLYALPQFIVPALEPLRVGVLGALLTAGGLLARWALGGAAPSAGGLRGLGLAAFLLAALISPVWSVSPEASRTVSIELCKMGVVYVCAASLPDSPLRLRRVLWCVGLAGCVPAWYAVSNAITGTNLLEGYRARWTGSFLDPNRLAMSVAASAMLLVALRARVRHPVSKLVVAAALALQLAAVIVTYSRGAALGVGAGLATYVLLGKGSRSRSVAAVAAMAIAVLALAPERFWDRTGTIASYREDVSALGRIHAWQTAANILDLRPLQGVGAGAFLHAWATYAPGEAAGRAYVAHNVFLEVAAELGVPALLGFLALVAACVLGAFRAVRRAGRLAEEARGILAALAAYVVCQLFAGYVQSFFLFLFLGLAAAIERVAARETTAEANPR